MLTVWSMSTGGAYDDYTAQRLQREVKKHLSAPHRFICISDRYIDGVITMRPPTDFPGWWGKVGLFKPGIATATNIWLDQDVVITGPLDDLLDYKDCVLAAPNNWAASGHNSVQSSVMVWKQSKAILTVYKDFRKEWARWPPVNDGGKFVPGDRGGWGDQEWLTVLRDAGLLDVTPINPDWVKSYKYHVRGRVPPKDCRLVVFHGRPKPSDPEVAAEAAWFRW